MHLRQLLPVAFLVGIAFTPSLQAQPRPRNISGTVTDHHREPLSGAVVQAHNIDTGSVVSYITGRDGRFGFKRLDGNCDYEISAAWRKQHSGFKKLSPFDNDKPRIINLVIREADY